MMVKQFSRGRGKNFSGRLRFFRGVFKLFLEGWNWYFLMGEVLEVTSKELKKREGMKNLNVCNSTKHNYINIKRMNIASNIGIYMYSE